MTLNLNRMSSYWNRDERIKINDNWDKIEKSFNGVTQEFDNAVDEVTQEFDDVVREITQRFDNAVDEVTQKAYDEIIDAVRDLTKINWLAPVPTYNDIETTYPNPTLGDITITSDDGSVYRYDGEQWVFINKIDPDVYMKLQDDVTAIQNGLEQLDNKVMTRLDDIAINLRNFPRQVPEVDDTARIQRAIDYAYSNSIGSVLFTNQEYIVSSTIHLKSNISLIGSKGTVIKVSDNCTGFYALFSIKSVENVTITGITYDGNYNRENYDISVNPEIAVYVVDSKNVRITDNVFNTCGIWTISCEVSETWPYNDHIYIERNTINYRVGKNSLTPHPINGMTVDTTQMYIDAKNYWVRDNIITTENTDAETAIEAHRRNGIVEGNIVKGFKNGVLIVPGYYTEDNESTKISITENKFYDIRSGITLWQTPVRDLEDVIINNNSIELNPERFPNVQTSKGILVLDTLPGDSGGKKIKNVLIADNIVKFKDFNTTFSDSAYVVNFVGISIRSWVTVENIKVVGNQIIKAPGTGIVIGASGDATYLNTASGLIVENNTIIDAGINENISTQSYNPRCAIRVNGSSVANVKKSIVQNNKIIDNKENGTYFTTPIYLASYDYDSCIIFNNPILAFGYNNINAKKSFNIDLRWDDQSGNPTLTKVSNYILKENYVKIFATIEVNDISSVTQGYATYISLPFAAKESIDLPILITDTNGTSSIQWFLALTAGSKIAYVKGITSNNTTTYLQKSEIKTGTKFSIIGEYLI